MVYKHYNHYIVNRYKGMPENWREDTTGTPSCSRPHGHINRSKFLSCEAGKCGTNIFLTTDFEFFISMILISHFPK